MEIDPAIIGGIIVALIAGLAGFASQKAISKATMINASVNSRAELEKEAYLRARSYDVDTIKRQDDDLDELRKENEELQIKIRALITHIIQLEEARGVYPGYPPVHKPKEIKDGRGSVGGESHPEGPPSE